MKKTLGMLIAFLGSFTESYGSQLEKYIISRNPKDGCDVERYTLDYNERQSKQGWLWKKFYIQFMIF